MTELTILGVYALVVTALALGLAIALIRAYGGNVEALRNGLEIGMKLFTFEQYMEHMDKLETRLKSNTVAWDDGLADIGRNAGKLVYGDKEALATRDKDPLVEPTPDV